ncbi:hypothetical protein GCM10010264_72640 [Streptomyces globisporus]|nr:hypothetical protein GCM10010264_72640 [Streptomyces globisporus]
MPYPFPGVEVNARSYHGVVAILPGGEERVVGEWVGDPSPALSSAIRAFHQYHRRAYVELMCDGVSVAYVAVNPRVPRGTPFLRAVGFCAHFQCGEIPPSECYCAA